MLQSPALPISHSRDKMGEGEQRVAIKETRHEDYRRQRVDGAGITIFVQASSEQFCSRVSVCSSYFHRDIKWLDSFIFLLQMLPRGGQFFFIVLLFFFFLIT